MLHSVTELSTRLAYHRFVCPLISEFVLWTEIEMWICTEHSFERKSKLCDCQIWTHAISTNATLWYVPLTKSKHCQALQVLRFVTSMLLDWAVGRHWTPENVHACRILIDKTFDLQHPFRCAHCPITFVDALWQPKRAALECTNTAKLTNAARHPIRGTCGAV